jgi:hypothetical protein
MSQKSPFPHLFQLFGRETEKHVESINRDALEKMIGLLELPVDAPGRCILLRAPRAGYGKSHLLSRVQSQLGSTHEFILLQPTDGYRVDASAALNDVLSKLTRALPGGAGLTVLDFLARKIFALGLEPLVRSGEVPCQDRETALTALQNRPVETFDFHHHTAVTAHWARDHFEILGPRLVVEIAQIISAPLREVGFWVDVLFRYAVTPIDQPGRSGMLMAAVVDASAAAPMNERLATLLKMLSQWQRVILVADELEGMSANAEAALRFAAFVTNMRHGAERVDMIISVNDDVWESAFVPRLSGGLQDRLSEAVVRLDPLTPEQARELLQSRDPQANPDETPNFTTQGPLYSRLVLRTAAQSWQPHEEEEIAETADLEKIAAVTPEEEFVEHSSDSAPEPELELSENPEIIEEKKPEFLSQDTLAVSWKALDRDALLASEGEPVSVPEKPVFVAPASVFSAQPIEEHPFSAQPYYEEPRHDQPHHDQPFSAKPLEHVTEISRFAPPETGTAVPIFSADKSFSEPDSPFIDDDIAVRFEKAAIAEEPPVTAFVPADATEAIAFEPSPYAFADETPVASFVPANASAIYTPEPETAAPAAAWHAEPRMIPAQIITPPPAAPQLTVVEDVPVLKPAAITAIKPSALPHGMIVDPSHTAPSYSSYGVPENAVPSAISATPPATYGTLATSLQPETPPSSEQPQTAEIDRVDELLRQFRERYGRSDS